MTEENEVEYPDMEILEENGLWILVSVLDVRISFVKEGEVLWSNNMLALHQDPLKYGLTNKNKKLQDLLEEWKKRNAIRQELVDEVNQALKRS